MVERIKHLCGIHGTNLSKLEKTLGFANGSLAKSDEKMQSGRLKALADYFNVSMEYLLTGAEKQSEKTINDFEYEIILAYRAADDVGKGIVLRGLGLETPPAQSRREGGVA